MNEASRAQINAAAPATSVWLSANAGSGKTRVLTDRVARLLLQGVGPERILCLTYTKAAAMEMQNRLFKRLGEWAMMPDAKLRAALQERSARMRSIPTGWGAHARFLPARSRRRAASRSRPSIPSVPRFCAASRSRQASAPASPRSMSVCRPG